MTDILLQIGATKLVLAIALGGTAWAVQQRVKRPASVHALWLMVLVAMLVPAVLPLRILPERTVVETVAQSGVAARSEVAPRSTPRASPAPLGGVEEEDVAQSEAGPPAAVADAGESGDAVAAGAWLSQNGKALAALLWVLGAAGFFAWTVARTVRFQRMLTSAARPDPRLQQLAGEIVDTLGLSRVPRVYTTDARVRPMVWWAGGRVRVLIPAVFVAELDEKELRAVLAHELAHVRRRDYLVRVVELLACSAYWWNPVVWWAKRRMRAAEESCCDVLAVAASRLPRSRYAKSLLRVVEIMSAVPTQRAPALASAADSCRDSRRLEQRLRTVLTTASPSPMSGRIRAAGAAALACGLSLGLVYCTPGERQAFDLQQSPTPVMTRDSARIRIVEHAGAPDRSAPFALAADPRYRHGDNPGDYRFRYIYKGALFA
ncbi:MAG: M56 family metallopeptidase, partial [Gemmatimonadetes bacterium]|nr:M56 family metallopeptidase [Gemmatimonadota bacterium]